MRFVPFAFAAALFAATSMFVMSVAPNDAAAQYTCRNKCNEQEQACLKRTFNKGQCGRKARACHAKCK